ncbi:MAG: iron-containing redox enzyme family protein, partial [Rhodospirillaceae bacterium]|nr:iron-containing redox enzyme family protein [Rhodospirillaceae bacterium]
IPVISRALAEGVPMDLYVSYLGQAYHHVRHTCPLLRAALDRCNSEDRALAGALREYILEEEGHEAWILDDIRDLVGPATVEHTIEYEGDPPVRALVGFMYDAIARRGPHAMLGMVHVLEGMSVQLAEKAAAAIAGHIGETPDQGFRYMMSHGSLDQEHVVFFRDLVNDISDPASQAQIIDTANMVYYLWGRMFDELDQSNEGASRAA